MTEGAAKYLRGSFHFAINSLEWIFLKAFLNSSMPISATLKFIAAKSLKEKSNKNLFSSTAFVVQYQVWTTLNITLLNIKKKKEMFQKHICPPPLPWCKIQVYLLCRSKTCPKFQIKSGLTLTFEHVTWKLIGIIYSLKATPAQRLVVIKGRCQKILSRQHLVYRPKDNDKIDIMVLP